MHEKLPMGKRVNYLQQEPVSNRKIDDKREVKTITRKPIH
jgi:hypothetical protein